MKIEATADGITLSEVYNGIGILTPHGLFGICQRDDGIEIMLDGELVWSSVHGTLAPTATIKLSVPPCDQDTT